MLGIPASSDSVLALGIELFEKPSSTLARVVGLLSLCNALMLPLATGTKGKSRPGRAGLCSAPCAGEGVVSSSPSCLPRGNDPSSVFATAVHRSSAYKVILLVVLQYALL